MTISTFAPCYVPPTLNNLTTHHEVDITELETQIMACAATELVNGFVPNLKVIDAGDLDKDIPPVFIIDGNQLYTFVGDVQVITAYIVKQVEKKWEEKYGKPKTG